MEDHEHPVLFDDSTGRGYIGFHGRLWEVLCPSISQREPSVRLISIRHLEEEMLRQHGQLRLLGVLQGEVTVKAAAQLVLSEQVVRAMQEESLRLPAWTMSKAGGYGPV